MANYTGLNATGATITLASSTISAVEYPIVQVPNTVNVVGSVQLISAPTTSVSGIVNINSVIGSFPGNQQHNLTDQGYFDLGVRNDTLASVSGVDNSYAPITVGPAGEVISANAPLTKFVSGHASILTPAAPFQPIIAAQGASIFTYITALQVANNSATVTLVDLYGATSSLIGHVVAAANTTIPITYPNPLKTNANGAFFASITAGAVPSVYLSAQGFISKT